MSFSGISAAEFQAQKERKDACINAALLEGTKSAALAGLVSGSLSMLMKRVSEAYRFKFTTGPRTAIVVMPIFTAFWFVSERQVMTCNAKRGNKWQSLDKFNGYTDK